MKVVNRSSRAQDWKEVILQPGDVWQDGVVKTAKPDPLDHDGDGRKGGSLPASKRGRPRKAK